MLTTETCPLFLGSVQRHKSLPAFQEGNVPPPLPVCLLLRQCLPAPSPATPKTAVFSHPGEKNNRSTARDVRGATAREDEGVFASPALRGCTAEAGPEKSGSHRKRSLDEVSGSFQPRGAGQELTLAPRTSSLAARVPQSHTGLCAIPSTCQRETHPGLPAPPVLPKREAAEPNPRPRLHLLLFLLHLHPPAMPHLPASRACSPGGFWGCKGGTAKRCKSQNSLWGTRAARSRHSRHRPTAVLGSQPAGAGFQAKRGREKPLLNRKCNCKGRRGGEDAVRGEHAGPQN